MKFIDSIINFFKRNFFKAQELKKEPIIQQSLEEELEKKEKPEEDLLFFIQNYDIIRAKRYNDETKKMCIPAGHREGPYIVLDKCEKGLICSKGTSVDQSERLDLYLKLENFKYNLFKETYFKCIDFEIINNYSFIEKLDELKKDDIQKLLKLVKKNFCYGDKNQYKKINIPFQVGDIINNVENYLIIDIKDNKLFCIKIKKATNYLKYNFKYKDHIFLDFSNIIVFDINNELEYINTIDNKLLSSILKKQKEYIENEKNQTIAQRGSIIKQENQYYYIYGEEGSDWLVFEILKCDVVGVKLDEVIIGDTVFYTNYNNIKINQKEKLEIIAFATDEEIEKIKKSKKSYSKNEKQKNLSQSKKNKNQIEINDEKYIIKERIGDLIGCVSIYDINKANARIKYFNINDIMIYTEEQSKQKNL